MGSCYASIAIGNHGEAVQVVVKMEDEEEPRPELTARVDRIIRAWNSHDALVAALRLVAPNAEAGEYETEYDGRMLAQCLGCSRDPDTGKHEEKCQFALASAALKAAGVKP